MDFGNPQSIWACLAIFLVAVLYSAVGHGGASGYLAVLSLLNLAPQAMSSTALVLNVLVAGLSAFSFFCAGYFRWSALYPFLLGSIPGAFIGGLLKLPESGYRQLLAVTLILAACRLAITLKSRDDKIHPVSLLLGVFSGLIIGLLSGIVGIGGGIFLSPLILLAGWDNAKGASATAAAFIVINSLAGLAARQISGTLSVAMFWPFILVALAGGVLGSRLGASVIPSAALRRLLALVLFIAACKLL